MLVASYSGPVFTYANPTVQFLSTLSRSMFLLHTRSKMEKIMGVFSLTVWMCMTAVSFFLFQVTAVLWCSTNGLNTTIIMESQNFKTAVLLIYIFVCFHMCLRSTNATSLETEGSLFCVVLFSYEHYFRCTTGHKWRTWIFSSECAKPLCTYFSFRVGAKFRNWIFRFPKLRKSDQQS